VVCRGIERLTQHLNSNNHAWDKGMVLEIGRTARMVSAFMDQAPEVKRGRR
jgi:hypothetical protein